MKRFVLKLWNLVWTRTWTEAQRLTMKIVNFVANKKNTIFCLKVVNKNARFLNSAFHVLRAFKGKGRCQKKFFFYSLFISCCLLAPRKNTSVAPDAPEAYGQRSRISDYDRSNGSGAIETARRAALWNAGGIPRYSVRGRR